MTYEPCMCGADDCRLCRPNSWNQAEMDDGYDEDDPKHSTWAEREEDRRDYEMECAAEDAYYAKQRGV